MRLIRFSGYLLYTLAVLCFLLWYKFPSDAVLTRAEKDLNRMTPSLQWDIGRISLLPPQDILLRNIRISSKSSKEKNELLFTIPWATLRPNLLHRQKTGELAATYRVRAAGGKISGRLALNKERSVLSYSGNVEQIRLDDKNIQKLLAEYDRTVSGSLSGSFTGKEQLADRTHTVRARLSLDQGSISMQEPVLGLEQLDFDQLTGDLQYAGGTLAVEQGEMKSRSLAAEFTLEIRTAPSLSPFSRISLKGTLMPEPGFIASFGGTGIVGMLRKYLQQNKLPFTISGPLKHPGIVFTKLPPGLNQQLQELQQVQQGGEQP
ncbi:MAG: type II secretion system protein GspN [Candidatus Electrothrix sp. YB6]